MVNPKNKPRRRRVTTASPGRVRTSFPTAPPIPKRQPKPLTPKEEEEAAGRTLERSYRNQQINQQFTPPPVNWKKPSTQNVVGGGLVAPQEPTQTFADTLAMMGITPKQYSRMSPEQQRMVQMTHSGKAGDRQITSTKVGEGETAYQKYTAPSLYLETPEGKTEYLNGKPVLNPVYNTSRFQDAMAGVAIGNQIASQSQDQFFRLGAIAGGAIAGLFSGDLAGYQLYNQAQTMAKERTKESMAETLATMQIKEAQAKIEYTAARTAKTNADRQLSQFKVIDANEKDVNMALSQSIGSWDFWSNPNYASETDRRRAASNVRRFLKERNDLYGITQDLDSLPDEAVINLARIYTVNPDKPRRDLGNGVIMATSYSGLPVIMTATGQILTDLDQIQRMTVDATEQKLTPEELGEVKNEVTRLFKAYQNVNPFEQKRLNPAATVLFKNLFDSVYLEAVNRKYKTEYKITGYNEGVGAMSQTDPTQVLAPFRQGAGPERPAAAPQAAQTSSASTSFFDFKTDKATSEAVKKKYPDMSNASGLDKEIDDLEKVTKRTREQELMYKALTQLRTEIQERQTDVGAGLVEAHSEANISTTIANGSNDGVLNAYKYIRRAATVANENPGMISDGDREKLYNRLKAIEKVFYAKFGQPFTDMGRIPINQDQVQIDAGKKRYQYIVNPNTDAALLADLQKIYAIPKYKAKLNTGKPVPMPGTTNPNVQLTIYKDKGKIIFVILHNF